MTGHLLVEAPGLMTTLQDKGRVGFQRLGVPVAGAIDWEALAAANVVVGNEPGTGALECLYQGPVLRVDCESVRLAVAGEGTEIILRRDDGREERIPPLHSIRAKQGDGIRVAMGRGARCAYLAVAGGFAVEPLMGSVATFSRGHMGGYEGRSLRAGDRLPLCEASAPGSDEKRLDGLGLHRPSTVRVVLGPQNDYFTDGAIATFLAESYTVTPASDRMGIRLDGRSLEHSRGYNIVSDAIAHGAIQVPGDGRPIILLSDRQTTGGYPKIATVASADLPALGRLAPGDRIRFVVVTVEEAEDLARAAAAAIAGFGLRLVGESNQKFLSSEALLGANLISGVVDAVGTTAADD